MEEEEKEEELDVKEKQMRLIEEKMVDKKDWQMMGEVKGKNRPVNSLLTEHLEFNQTQKIQDKEEEEELETELDKKIK